MLVSLTRDRRGRLSVDLVYYARDRTASYAAFIGAKALLDTNIYITSFRKI